MIPDLHIASTLDELKAMREAGEYDPIHTTFQDENRWTWDVWTCPRCRVQHKSAYDLCGPWWITRHVQAHFETDWRRLEHAEALEYWNSQPHTKAWVDSAGNVRIKIDYPDKPSIWSRLVDWWQS